MYKYNIKPGFIFLLIYALLFCQLFPDLARADESKPDVAFIGIRFKKVSPEIEKLVLNRISAILEQEDEIILTTPEGARKVFGQENINALLARQDPQSISAFAKHNQFDYVIYGTIINESSDSNQVFLSGEINRFDRIHQQIQRHTIAAPLARLDQQLEQFRARYISNLSSGQKSGFKLGPFIILVGLVFASTLLFKAVSSGGPQEDQKPGPVDE